MSVEDPTVNVADDGGANARIRQLVARVKELEAKVTETTPLAAEAENLRSQLAEWEKRYSTAESNFALERKLMSHGFMDEEARDIVTWAYDRLPKGTRPPIEEWIANRDGLPKAVRAYLSEASVTSTAAQSLERAAAVQTAPAPTAPATARAAVNVASDAPQSWTPEAIARLSPAEFKANRDAIFAALRAS